jgi:hypothetical protein
MCTTTPTTTDRLPAVAPAAARTFVRDSLCGAHARDAEAAAMLLASELVTDAILCGEVPASITLECRESELSLEVSSTQAGAAAPSPSWQRELTMLLMNKVARTWGTDRVGDGVVRWCTVPTGTVPASHPARRRLAAVGDGVLAPGAAG